MNKKPRKPLDKSVKSNRHGFEPRSPAEESVCLVCGHDRHHPYHR